MDEESCATARGRDDVRAITGSADQRVVWRGTVQKFSSGGSGFDPSFSEAEKVRIVGCRSDQTVQQNEKVGEWSEC